MDEQSPDGFLLPVTYWPARSGTYWWDDFRREEVVRDFNLASAAGVKLLHLTIPWQISQPHAEEVSLTLMRDLEVVLRVASDTGMRCLPSIAVASVFGTLVLPHWFYELTADDRGQPRRVMRRLYDDPLVLAATARLIGEVTGEFGSHPSIEGWIVGDGLSSVSPPRSIDQVDAWLDRMQSVAQLRGRRVWHGVSARDLAWQSALRLRTFSEAGFGTLVHVDWMPPWAHDTRHWTAFLVVYVRALGGLPPLISGTGRFPIPPLGVGEDRLDDMLGELRAAGAAGLIWPALFNYDPQLRSRRPFSSAPEELSRGLLPTGGTMAPPALAWLDAMSRPAGVTAGTSSALDDELRSREPEEFMRAVYRDFAG